MRILDHIQTHDVILDDDGSVSYTAKADIDSDGTGPHHGDRTAQNDTSLHFECRPLNADVDRYIVVPPQIRNAVAGVVLGCQAHVTFNGRTVTAVVGDIGPRAKLGEMSIACARALGIPDSPVSGGVASGVTYRFEPGIPAIVDGKQFLLQHA